MIKEPRTCTCVCLYTFRTPDWCKCNHLIVVTLVTFVICCRKREECWVSSFYPSHLCYYPDQSHSVRIIPRCNINITLGHPPWQGRSQSMVASLQKKAFQETETEWGAGTDVTAFSEPASKACCSPHLVLSLTNSRPYSRWGMDSASWWKGVRRTCRHILNPALKRWGVAKSQEEYWKMRQI